MKIQLNRSKVLEGNTAKAPTAAQLDYGELAVNYATADPTIFMKTSTDQVIKIAGANALTTVPDLNAVTTQGNFSDNSILIGGTSSIPNTTLDTSGNITVTGTVTAAVYNLSALDALPE